MRNKGLVLLLLLVGSQLFAQQSEKAKALLDEVYNKVKSYNNIQVDFKYELYNSEADIHQCSG